jgi:hypothetical protein
LLGGVPVYEMLYFSPDLSAIGNLVSLFCPL